MTIIRISKVIVNIAAALMMADVSGVGVTSQPGTTVVRDAAGDTQLVNCERERPRKPCTLGVAMSREQRRWVDIASAEIRQIDAGTVDLSMTLQASIPQVPNVPILIYYWQFQDGCNASSPTDKDGVNVFWNGRAGPPSGSS